MSISTPGTMIAASWDAAPFAALAETASAIHDALVKAVAPAAPERVLDVATGTGPVALRAARRGCEVVGLDISPRMVAAARAAAAETDVRVAFVLGEAEALPFERGSFDCVLSAQGVMFSRDPRQAAAELARVCRPQGRLGLSVLADSPLNREFLGLWSHAVTNRRPSRLEAADWGSEQIVRTLLGRWFSLEFVHGRAPLVAADAAELWELHLTTCGPLKHLHDRLPHRRRITLRAAYVEFFDRFQTEEGVSLPRDYLLILGRRANVPAT
ncbi:MAG: methyltransferase domain-containing protein [Gaiellaceae bacterium]